MAGGGYPSPLNYCSFPKSCCTSVNEVICHGIPDARPLEDGDIVNLDISVFLGGFHADLNETVLCGTVDAAGRALVKGAWDCLAAAIAIVKPGTRFRDPGDVISTKASQAGLSVGRTYCGHGIGCARSQPAPGLASADARPSGLVESGSPARPTSRTTATPRRVGGSGPARGSPFGPISTPGVDQGLKGQAQACPNPPNPLFCALGGDGGREVERLSTSPQGLAAALARPGAGCGRAHPIPWPQ